MDKPTPWKYDSEKQKARLNRIKDRYFRPVIAYPEGHLTHHGDCSIHRAIDVYGTAACTCGFLHDLRILPESLTTKLYPKMYEELVWEDGPPAKPTPEERAELEAMMEKAFPKSSRIGPSPEEWQELCIQDWTLIEEVFGNLFRQRKEADWLALDDEDN